MLTRTHRFFTIATLFLLPLSATAAPLADSPFSAALPSDMLVGSSKAKLLIIEYSSFTCPHCAYFQQSIFPKLKEKYIKKDLVKFIHRDFPLDKPSLDAAVIAHCGGKENYWTFLKVFFDQQDSWAFQKNYLEILSNIAKLGGMSQATIEACLENNTLRDTILEVKMLAIQKGKVNSTPTFFIAGKEYKGISNWEAFSQIIEDHLKQP